MAGRPMAERTEAMGKATLRLPEALLKAAKHYAVDADLDLQEVVARVQRQSSPQWPGSPASTRSLTSARCSSRSSTCSTACRWPRP